MIAQYIKQDNNDEINTVLYKIEFFIVYGILEQEGKGKSYLIRYRNRDKNYINIFPENSFHMISPDIPEYWLEHYDESLYNNGHIAFAKATVIGYTELVNSPDHFPNLIDNLTDSDREIFEKNRKETFNWNIKKLVSEISQDPQEEETIIELIHDEDKDEINLALAILSKYIGEKGDEKLILLEKLLRSEI